MHGLLKKILLIIIIIPFIYFLSLFIFPNISYLKEHNPQKTSFMKYREHQWKKKGLNKKVTQKWVPLTGISQNVVKAVVAAEDGKFWTHNGFDFAAIKEAFEKNLERKKFSFGASTVTQQLARNLYLSPSKNPVRKFSEAIITWRLEKKLDKKRIMELYLNIIEWGDGIFGIEAAARHYYGKSAASLSAAEAARLIAVLPNPIRFKVNGSSRYIAKRTSIILARMYGKRKIYDDELQEAPPVENGADASPENTLNNEDVDDNFVESEEVPVTEQPPDSQQTEESPLKIEASPDSAQSGT